MIARVKKHPATSQAKPLPVPTDCPGLTWCCYLMKYYNGTYLDTVNIESSVSPQENFGLFKQ